MSATITTARVADRMHMEDSTRVRLDNGFLRVRARLSRTGIQEYLAAELGVQDRPAGSVIRVWRPDEEVFAPDSMASFQSVPVTDDHPSGGVTADNARQHTRGWTSETVEQEGDHTVAWLTVSDAGLIRKIEGGKVEVSNGYGCELVWESGVTPKGEAYDAIQRNIRGNHVAVVDAGRCGASCSIQDHSVVADCDCNAPRAPHIEEPKVADVKTVTALVDGLQVETTEAGKAAIDKLLADLSAANAKITAADAKATTDTAAWNTERARLEAEAATAKAAIPTGDALDKLVAARSALVADAKRLVPALDCNGKTDAEIRTAVVTAKLGDSVVARKSPEFFDHAYDLVLAQNPAGQSVQQDAARQAFDGGLKPAPGSMDAANEAHAKMVQDQQNAWRTAAPTVQ